MKRVTLSLTPVRYYGVMAIAGILVCLYFFRVIETYYAFIRYTQFLDTASLQVVQLERSEIASRGDLSAITQAIRHDRNNAEYYAALGEYLSDRYIGSPQTDIRVQHLREAESWLVTALRYNPPNPWYYYDLGRLSASRNDCVDRQSSQFPDALAPCLTARYFLSALSNAPTTLFLRRQVGLWYYGYDRDRAFRMMQDIVARTAGHKLDDRELALGVAKFLYDMQLDYQSDLAYPSEQSVMRTQEVSNRCQPLTITTIPPDPEAQRGTVQEFEFGSDDGSADWRTYISSEEVRVKKVLCVPENLAEYSSAALKILMNNGGKSNFEATVTINEYVIKRYTPTDPVPRIAAWYEIPFDKNLLQGQSRINVYIRVTGGSGIGNSLQIWSDHNTSIGHSVFNFNMTDDLSYNEGRQTGEYMIRLVLRKS
jgi:hypothetical protein